MCELPFSLFKVVLNAWLLATTDIDDVAKLIIEDRYEEFEQFSAWICKYD